MLANLDLINFLIVIEVGHSKQYPTQQQYKQSIFNSFSYSYCGRAQHD